MKGGEVALLACLIAGCTFHPTATESQADPFTIEIEDIASDQTFRISIKSEASVPLCIAREGWPDNLGRVSEVFDINMLHAGGEIKANGFHPPMCIGGCEPIVIAPFNRLDAKIAYSNFGAPGDIANLRERTLKANVFAHACTPADFPIDIASPSP